VIEPFRLIEHRQLGDEIVQPDELPLLSARSIMTRDQEALYVQNIIRVNVTRLKRDQFVD